MTLYERGNGKTARHGLVESASSIGLLSYIPVQLWQYHRLRKFKAHFGDTGRLNVCRYAHLSAAQFLYMIPTNHISCLGHGSTVLLELDTQIFEKIWSQLLVDKSLIQNAVKKLL